MVNRHANWFERIPFAFWGAVRIAMLQFELLQFELLQFELLQFEHISTKSSGKWWRWKKRNAKKQLIECNFLRMRLIFWMRKQMQKLNKIGKYEWKRHSAWLTILLSFSYCANVVVVGGAVRLILFDNLILAQALLSLHWNSFCGSVLMQSKSRSTKCNCVYDVYVICVCVQERGNRSCRTNWIRFGIMEIWYIDQAFLS